MKASAIFDLTGEIALVTGASSGLGERFARVLAANGAKVVAVARRKSRLDALVADIGSAGGEAVAVEADIGDNAALAAAFDAAEAAFGTVTILVNNAGVGLVGDAIDQPEAVWRDTMRINLDAVYFAAQIAAQRLVKAGKPGAIVNLASILGLGVSRGLSAYSVAKAGVIHLTQALAAEWGGKGVRVNALAPGYFITEMNEDYLVGEAGERMKKAVPLRRFGAAGDLDGPLLLLASRAGAYVNGATITVDGGHRTGLRG